ncbi:MAG TPA: hypothetical protein VG273_12670 [Bryobacteraceae bacterium]|nr:hypothetical protein [Bryobacteraceae bacterium]
MIKKSMGKTFLRESGLRGSLNLRGHGGSTGANDLRRYGHLSDTAR